MKSEFNNLRGVFEFMSIAYYGNWKYRWGGTPYFDEKTESIIGHEYGCALLWLVLRRVCPALNKIVDSTRVYEICLTHDLGETYEGDISRFQQLKGQGVDKHSSERQAINMIASKTKVATREEIIAWFDEFEKKPEEIENIEILIVRFLDSLQGDHFALTFGHDLPSHSEVISKIVNKHTVPFALRLMEVLKTTGHNEACEEVGQIFLYHKNQIKAAGINLDIENCPK